MKKGHTLFVLDIDATLADATARFEKAGPEPSRQNQRAYLAWLDRLQNEKMLAEDVPVPGMANMARCLWAGGGSICYITGREEKYRDVTLRWLSAHGFPLTGPLFMRKEDSWESVRAVKEPYIKHQVSTLQPHSVIIVDDDPNGDLELMCQENGWTLLKAMSGGKHK